MIWLKYDKLTLNSQKLQYLPFTSSSNDLTNLGTLIIDNKTIITKKGPITYLEITIEASEMGPSYKLCEI